jgi:hypothetical protein
VHPVFQSKGTLGVDWVEVFIVPEFVIGEEFEGADWKGGAVDFDGSDNVGQSIDLFHLSDFWSIFECFQFRVSYGHIEGVILCIRIELLFFFILLIFSFVFLSLFGNLVNYLLGVALELVVHIIDHWFKHWNDLWQLLENEVLRWVKESLGRKLEFPLKLNSYCQVVKSVFASNPSPKPDFVHLVLAQLCNANLEADSFKLTFPL